MESFPYMCGECFQAFDSINAFSKHCCQVNIENTGRQQESAISLHTGQGLTDSSQEPDLGIAISHTEDLSDTIKEQSCGAVSEIHPNSLQRQSEDEMGSPDSVEMRYGDDASDKVVSKKRKKYKVMDEAYRLNRTMRDKDFKLARSNFYSFKDTLGDWDERSTQLLIQLIHTHPQTYFLLPVKNERRMSHWEKLHKEMEMAGYNFTILQLRMRWREVLQKYRWTVNYNDIHEIKKRCEYFDEMNELCGDWDKEATWALLRQMHRIKQENKGKKIVRIGYSGWEKITENLNMEGHKFTIYMVEGRWRNMVTLYKTMVDHNNIPNVEPQTVAYKADLEELIKYVPQRRNNYEKKVGRSVKMERFPSDGCRILLQAYKDCMSRFMDPKVDNRILWDEITQKLDDEGFCFATCKLKEILTGMIKGFEKCQYHNSLPGAIRRDVPYYRELAEVYGVYGRWPHIQTSRTLEMKNERKYRLRLQVSQQLWRLEESRTLLQVYPDVLESHMNQCLNHQPSDLWLQVAKVYSGTGYPKRDVPEIAVHIGLLRQGYAQKNKFPFVEEMRKVRETEEAVCYSPDVSKYTGEVEITYWSHEAVNNLLDLYIKHQSAAEVSHASRNEVFVKVKNSMNEAGYKYTKEEICEQFKFLLTQYNTRKSKPWMLPPVGRQTRNPVGEPYLDKLQKVLELRRQMSLSWTTGVKPLVPQAVKILLQVAYQKADELLIEMATEREKKSLLGQIVDGIIGHIRIHSLIDPVPRTRQVRLHIADAVKNFDETTEEDKHIAHLYKLFKDYDMLDLVSDLSLEPTNYDYRINSKKRKLDDSTHSRAVKVTRRRQIQGSSSEVTDDFADTTNIGWTSELSCLLKNQKVDEVCEYLALALCHLSRVCQNSDMKNINMGMNGNPKSSTEVFNDKRTGSGSSQFVSRLSSSDKSCVRSTEDTYASVLTKPLNLQHIGMMNIDQKNNSEIRSFSKSTSPTDIYSKVFGKVQSSFPIHHIRKGNSMLYTISSDSEVNLNILLPNELGLQVESVPVYKKDCLGKHCKQRTDIKLCKDNFVSNTSDSSETNSLSKQEQLDLKDEWSDSVPQNGEHSLATKIIQTRSGRKTRFTFFSHTLNDGFEDKLFEESDLHGADVASSLSKTELGHESHSCPHSKRKRGRPKKVSHENNVVDCDVAKDDVSVIQRVSTDHMSYIPQENLNSKLKRRCSSKDPILSLIKDHLRIETAQEKELVKIMKEHQKEHTNILGEMCSIMEDLNSKINKNNL